jgi:hypothetical protein
MGFNTLPEAHNQIRYKEEEANSNDGIVTVK